MKAFGIQVNQHSLPFIYLACIPIAFLLIRQSYPAFWPSISTRAITVFLELGFILLATPNIAKLKIWNASPKYLLIISLWGFCAGLSTLLGDYPWAGSVRWFELVVNLIFGLYIYLLIQDSPEYKSVILYSVMISLLFTLVIYLGLWITLEEPYSYDWVSASPFFNNIRHYGYFIATALPLGYWLLEKSDNNNSTSRKLTPLVYLSLAWALLFWSGGRGALLGVMIATACFFIIAPSNIKWVLTSILLGGGLSQFFIVESSSLNLFHILSWFNTLGETSLNTLSANRIVIYTDAITFWWTNNPLLGAGADAYRYIKPGNHPVSHPHNIFIQLLFSYGIVGLLIPTGLFILLIFRQFESYIKQNFVIFLCIISASIHALTDGVFYHAYSLLITTIIIALCLPHTKIGLQSQLKLVTSLFILSIITFSIFSTQIIQSKNQLQSKAWIEWNMKYPLYFSPENWLENTSKNEKDYLINFSLTHSENKCWLYSRHSSPNKDTLKQYCQ